MWPASPLGLHSSDETIRRLIFQIDYLHGVIAFMGTRGTDVRRRSIDVNLTRVEIMQHARLVLMHSSVTVFLGPKGNSVRKVSYIKPGQFCGLLLQ